MLLIRKVTEVKYELQLVSVSVCENYVVIICQSNEFILVAFLLIKVMHIYDRKFNI